MACDANRRWWNGMERPSGERTSSRKDARVNQTVVNVMRRCAVVLAALAAIAVPASVPAMLAGQLAAQHGGDPDDGGQLLADPQTISSTGDSGPAIDPPPSSSGSNGSGTGQ